MRNCLDIMDMLEILRRDNEKLIKSNERKMKRLEGSEDVRHKLLEKVEELEAKVANQKTATELAKKGLEIARAKRDEAAGKAQEAREVADMLMKKLESKETIITDLRVELYDNQLQIDSIKLPNQTLHRT